MGYLVVYSLDDLKSAHYFDTYDNAADFINDTNESASKSVLSEVSKTDEDDVFIATLKTGQKIKIEIISVDQHSVKYDLSYTKNRGKPTTRRYASKENAIAYAHKFLEELDADADPGEDEQGEWMLNDPERNLTAHILLMLVVLSGETGISDYRILGCSQNATKDEVKAAFRTMARKHHPDVGGDAKKFTEIRNAYERIMDGNPHKATRKILKEYRCFAIGKFFEDLSQIIEQQKARLYQQIRSKASSTMITGIIFFVIGLALTGASSSSAKPGDNYIIFTGLIGVGIYDFFKGAYYYLYPEAAIKKAKK